VIKMQRKTRWLMTGSIAATLLGVVAPAAAVSLAATGPAQPRPDQGMSAVSMPVAENLTAGSAALVPLVAAEIPATELSAIDTGAHTGGGDIGKPIDDISFLARATESARKEMSAARDALTQLTDPELKRVAEALIKDHTEANTRMARIADEKRWPLPAQPRGLAPPAGTAAADFDAVWTDDTILAHERALALYSAQAQGGEDSDLRQYARETLPTIQNHLAELRRLQK
jgi:putative membrane protein